MATKKAAAAAPAPVETTSAPAPAPAERELPTVTRDLVFNFDEFVGYGKAMQSHLSDTGMPWSFAFFGINVTHENDDSYILPEGKFNRGDALRVQIVHRGAEIESVTLGITTPKQTGDFDNELKYLDKAVAIRPVDTVVEHEPAQKSGREAIVEIIDHLKAKGDALTENEATGLRHLKLAVTALDGAGL